MKHTAVLTLTFLLFFLAANAQDTAHLKRTPRKLIMPIDKGMQYVQDVPADAYLLPDNSLQIYPGDTVYIEVTLENDVIKNMVAVKENTHPEKTMTVTFMQVSKRGKHEMMMLKINNPFKQTLVYQAKMFLLKGNHWISTDVMPVQGSLDGIETWPGVIVSLALGIWQFQSK